MKKTKQTQIKNFIIDVDGVMTDGKFFYSKKGKLYKVFGPDDSDALNLIKNTINIHFVSGDKRGFEITRKRIEIDMGFPLDQVSTFDRVKWIAKNYNPKETVYMGDGIFDPLVFRQVCYSIAPQNAFYKTKLEADFVTNSKGGEGAVAEACFHLMEKFFTPIDIHALDFKDGVGVWK